ncbi:MAG: hypothetical protein MMC23_002590 [Stictis urceolatum]|nr:hypothetical protein [Stictis urceolata]
MRIAVFDQSELFGFPLGSSFALAAGLVFDEIRNAQPEATSWLPHETMLKILLYLKEGRAWLIGRLSAATLGGLDGKEQAHIWNLFWLEFSEHRMA